MNGTKYFITNTCAFDSITEVLSTSCLTVIGFYKYLEERQDETLYYLCYPTTVINYANDGVSSNIIYTRRAHTLENLARNPGNSHLVVNQNNTTINCVSNAAPLFEKLMDRCYSFSVMSVCQCNPQVEVTWNSVIPLPNMSILHEKNYSNLEEEVNNYFSEGYVDCSLCKLPLKHVGYDLTDTRYICIDTESAYVNLSEEGPEIKSTLSQLPEKITVFGKEYILTGAVRVDSAEIRVQQKANQEENYEQSERGVSHYIAYTRSLNNQWTEKNDLLNKIHCAGISNKRMQLALLLYVLAE